MLVGVVIDSYTASKIAQKLEDENAKSPRDISYLYDTEALDPALVEAPEQADEGESLEQRLAREVEEKEKAKRLGELQQHWSKLHKMMINRCIEFHVVINKRSNKRFSSLVTPHRNNTSASLSLSAASAAAASLDSSSSSFVPSPSLTPNPDLLSPSSSSNQPPSLTLPASVEATTGKLSYRKLLEVRTDSSPAASSSGVSASFGLASPPSTLPGHTYEQLPTSTPKAGLTTPSSLVPPTPVSLSNSSSNLLSPTFHRTLQRTGSTLLSKMDHIEERADFRSKLIDLIRNARFKRTMLAVLFLNFTVLCCHSFYVTPSLHLALEILNLAFVFIYLIEILIRLAAAGSHFIYHAWNIFDLILVSLAIAEIPFFVISLQRASPNFSGILSLYKTSNGESLAIAAQVLRACRVGRLVRFIRLTDRLRVLLDTVTLILPSLSHLALLYVVLFFVYGLVGMNVFGSVMYQSYLNRHNNFQDILSSLLTLVRAGTGERWNVLMHECMLLGSYKGVHCVENQSWESRQSLGVLGCGTMFSVVFWISFIIVVFFIGLQLFIAAVIEGFNDSINLEHSRMEVKVFDQFLIQWKQSDPHSTGWISPQVLAKIFCSLPPPLGLKLFAMQNVSLQSGFKLVKRMDLPVYAHQVHFTDVCAAIARKFCSFQFNMPEAEIDPEFLDASVCNDEVMRRWTKRFPGVKGQEAQYLTSDLFAVLFVQSLYRGFKQRRKLQQAQSKKKGKANMLTSSSTTVVDMPPPSPTHFTPSPVSPSPTLVPTFPPLPNVVSE
eukprot:GILI01008124.1.p1 GENE.GILI01008124.1~~GILI01008124.1.p1  ORF type:complete len:860 (+),score=212.34 GILI01008124.1:248-2581(+)